MLSSYFSYFVIIVVVFNIAVSPICIKMILIFLFLLIIVYLQIWLKNNIPIELFNFTLAIFLFTFE